MSSPTPELSVVIAVYNEQDNVAPLCDGIREALTDWGPSWEVVLVDDGSRDATRARLLEVHLQDPRFRALSLRKNSGQTLAMATGFTHARGAVIVSMDGDLQNDPRDIPMLVSRLLQGFDVVCGWRRDRQDAWLSRTLPSKIANRLIAWVTGIPIHDNGCSLKAYRAEVIQSLNLYSEMHRFLPALSAMTGARIAEVVVRHHPRIHGESKYGLKRTFQVLADMITIKMIAQFSSRPGRWFGRLSLPWLGLGVVAASAWRTDAWLRPEEVSIVLPSLSVLFLWLFGNLLLLSLVSEALVAQADRRYLRRLAEVLTARWTHSEWLASRRERGSEG